MSIHHVLLRTVNAYNLLANMVKANITLLYFQRRVGLSPLGDFLALGG